MTKIRDRVQKEATESIISNRFYGIIDVAPRVGKSKIVIDSLRKVSSNIKILITVPYNAIIDDGKGGGWVNELEKWKVAKSKMPKLINQISLDKEPDEYYDLIICDEIHSLSENQIEQVKRCSKGAILGLTGSLSKGTKLVLKKELGLKVIFEYSIEQAIKDGIIADYEINIVICNLDPNTKNIEGGTKKKPFMTTEYSQYHYLTRQFNRFKHLSWNNASYSKVKMMWAGKRSNFIYNAPLKIEVAKKLIKKYDRALIFSSRKKVAEDLCENVYHSTSEGDELTKFISGVYPKLGVVETVQMGITIPNLKVGIFHQMKSNEESAIQKVLRMCNLEEGEKAKIYILVYMGTVDEDWLNKALLPFEDSKINYLHHTQI